MRWITTQRLQDEFALPRALAREIVVEQWQAALRSRWQPWLWLACWALLVLACWSGWLPWSRGVHEPSAAVWLTLVASWGWIGIGRWLAGPAMLASAAVRARRLRDTGEAWAPHVDGAGNTPSSTAAPPARVPRP
jgi:hypothetical protein